LTQTAGTKTKPLKTLKQGKWSVHTHTTQVFETQMVRASIDQEFEVCFFSTIPFDARKKN